METKCKFIKLFLDHPFDYKKYLNTFENPKYALRVIKNLIPEDTGIEMEVGSIFTSSLRSHKILSKYIKTSSYDCTEFNFRINTDVLDSRLKVLKLFFDWITQPYFDYHRSNKSGIHIHTNIGMLATKRLTDRSNFNYLRGPNVTKVIEKLFQEYFEYKGQYNSLMFASLKGNALIVREDFDTLEFRGINITWDFRTMLKHLIVCHMFAKLFRQVNPNDETFIPRLYKLLELIMLIKRL